MKDLGTKRLKQDNNTKILHVYVIMFLMCIFIALLTYLLPAGTYQRMLVDGRNIVVPGSYEIIERTPVGPWGLFNSVAQGWSESASIIFLVFMVGGAIKVIEDTGFIEGILSKSMKAMKGKEIQVVLLVSFLLSLLGATGTFSTANIAIVPIALAFSRRLGYDKLLAFALSYLAVNVGFSAGWVSVFTTAIAQDIAELPRFSGIFVRILEHAVFFAIYAFFIVRYLKKIKIDPSASIAPFEKELLTDDHGQVSTKLTTKQLLAGAVFILSFVALIYGAMVLQLNTTGLTTIFFIMAVLGGLLGGLGLNGTANSFAAGLRGIASGAFIVGMAKAISVVMVQGNIIDSVVHYLTMPISAVGSVIGANVMLLFNLLFNFLISSGSGQAVAVMPVMVPLADLTNITRQVAVEAFKLGDGLSNIIVPTAGAMMACLGIAEVPYSKYVKWVIPYLLATVVVALIVVTIGQSVGWQ